MNRVPLRVGKAEVDKLESILGEDWVAQQLDEYREFRANYSPVDLWSHRRPKTPPIVPLLFYFHHPESRKEQGNQPRLDCWLGNDPLAILAEVAGCICFFEDYWSALPNDLGRDNIQHKLTNAGQFYGFYHELLAAGHYSHTEEYKDYTVKPLFFDPQTSRGQPDIVMQRGDEQIDIQCKARSPLDAYELPFDLFFYLFGYLHRLVQDSWNSYWVLVFPKRTLHDQDVEQLISLLDLVIPSSLDIPTHDMEDFCEVTLRRLDIPIGGLDQAAIRGITGGATGSLYTAYGQETSQADENRFDRVAILSASTPRTGRSFGASGRYVENIVSEAAREAQGNNPLILCIRLYGQQSESDDMTTERQLTRRLDRVFQLHRRIRQVDLVRSVIAYAASPDGAQRSLSPLMQIPNRYHIERIA